MKLLEQLAAACRTMNFARSTEECYSAWVVDYLRFHRRCRGDWVHPSSLREPEVEAFLTHLAVNRRLAASSQSQALCALVFLYRAVLRNPLGRHEAVRAKRPERVPTVLSVGEVGRLLAVLDRHPTHGLLARLLYGAGLRVGEGCTLRVMDLDFDRRQIVVRGAKGFKDRVVPLPQSTVPALHRQADRVSASHAGAVAKGPDWGWAPVPSSVAHKRPAAGREPGWQYLFPSAVTTPNRITAAFSFSCLGGNPFDDEPDKLSKLAKEVGASLTVVDPLAAFVPPSAWSSSPAAARAALQPFYAVTGINYGAVLLIRHTAKGRSPWSVDRGLGSIGMIGSARTAWLVARHPDDPDLRVLGVTKQSAAPPGRSLGFRLRDRRVVWEGPVDIAADELAGDSPRAIARRPRERAADWLRNQLATGPKPAAALVTAAIKAGYPERTLNRAKADARFGSKVVERDRKKTWYWFDPEVSDADPPLDVLTPLSGEEECSPIW